MVVRLLVGATTLLLALPSSQSFAREPAGAAAQGASALRGPTFVRGRSIQNQYVMWTRADGSVMRFVRGFDPVWSPNGRELAYLALRPTAPSAGMESDIFIRSADGRHRRRLTNDPSQEWGIEWSPTGAQIAYSKSGCKSRPAALTLARRDEPAMGRRDHPQPGSGHSLLTANGLRMSPTMEALTASTSPAPTERTRASSARSKARGRHGRPIVTAWLSRRRARRLRRS